ncbi:protein lethal(2)essential for life-like [Copidosoma floridanum]|uniref:protein lethal(2)essential for life-like n=1 Tax=Copidosoma floridanum TaxID=29053 RepID=UPI0006C9E1D0|nr:protein lethal(2)essential for life-like [Copidosoma floridanum]
MITEALVAQRDLGPSRARRAGSSIGIGLGKSLPELMSNDSRDSHTGSLASNFQLLQLEREDFHKTVDCAGFALNEIKVFVEDGLIEVKAIHDEVQDEHGNVYKNLPETFPVSETYNFNGAKITLSLDGALTVYIPCKNKPFVDTNYTTNNPSNNEPTEEN